MVMVCLHALSRSYQQCHGSLGSWRQISKRMSDKVYVFHAHWLAGLVIAKLVHPEGNVLKRQYIAVLV